MGKIYKILFIAATSWELKIIKQEVKKIKLQNMKLYFWLSWIWNYSIILSLDSFLNKQKYDFIVNIWVCWYTAEYQKIIQISRIKNLANNDELIVPVLFKFAALKSIASSEKVIFSDKDMLWEDFVEMESYWIELVCTKFQIPRIILKVPIDKVWKETKNFDFKKAKKLLVENIDYKKLVKNIWEYLAKNNSVENVNLQSLQKYQEYYKMTFSEKVIFEKLFNKYLVLVEEDWGEKFGLFFEKNKELNKKDFFVKLQAI